MELSPTVGVILQEMVIKKEHEVTATVFRGIAVIYFTMPILMKNCNKIALQYLTRASTTKRKTA